MAYVYEVSFDIRPDQMSELEIGASLERVLGYMRVLLPNQPGHVSSQAMYSLDVPDKTHLVFHSTWDTWEDVDAHRRSSLAEDKVLAEFQPHVALEDLTVHVYAEVA
jgi:heme-degrading monooxygenase HmoA